MVLYLFVSVVLSWLIAEAGKKRKIGWTWAFLLSLTLSPIIGWLITMANPLKEAKNGYFDKRSWLSITIGAICFAIGVFFLINVFQKTDVLYTAEIKATSLTIASGLMLLGIYLSNILR